MRGIGRLDYLAAGLSTIPLLLLLQFVTNHYIDSPMSDQWRLSPLVQAYIDGSLTFSGYWVQLNAHRILFPKLLMFPLAKLTHWNHAYEVALIFALLVMAFVLIAFRVWETYRSMGMSRVFAWLNILLLSILILSPSQSRNLLWGMQIQVMLNFLTSVAGLMVVSRTPTPARLAVGIALGFVATHSFANGVTYWVVGLAVLMMGAPGRGLDRRVGVSVWVVFAVPAILSFFVGLTPTGPGLLGVLQDPIAYVHYVLVYLGNPIVPYHLASAAVIGFIGLTIAVMAPLILVHRENVAMRSSLPFIAIALYGVTSAAMTAVGRTHLGYSQALTSRYVTFGQLLWAADITFLCMLLARYHARERAVVMFDRHLAIGLTLGALVASIITGHLHGREREGARADRTNSASSAIVASYPVIGKKHARALSRSKPEYATEQMHLLFAKRLSFFRDVEEAAGGR